MRAACVLLAWAAVLAAAAPLGGQVSTLAGTCNNQDVSLDCVGSFADGRGTLARFSAPYSVALSVDGKSLVVADQDNNALRSIELSTGLVKTLSGGGSPGYADGASASFSHPTGVATGVDAVFVADMDNHVVRRVTAKGSSTLAGSGVAGWADGTAEKAMFNLPTSVAVGADFVFVSDYLNQRVRRIALDSGLVETLAGSCGAKPGITGSAQVDCPGGYADGAGSAALFSLPSGVALSSDGKTLFVTEERGNRVRAIGVADGVVSTLAGSGLPGYADGAGTAASFSSPTGLAATPDGLTLIVADALNMCLRSVSIADGEVRTLAGGAPGFADGDAAAFFVPTGVAVSADGRALFVADSGNEAVRRVELLQ